MQAKITLIRLDKLIAQQLGVNCVIAGRETRINRVIIDGEIVKNSAFRLLPERDVEYDGNPLVQQNGPRYFMLNKPQGYVYSMDNPDRPTVFHFFDKPVACKLHAAGCLDIDTIGLALATDNRQWLYRTTPFCHHCKKAYLVTLESPVADDTAKQFAHDVQLHSEKDLTKLAVLEVITLTQVRLAISEGRYHQVKYMFTVAGDHVVKLYCERIGDIKLDDDLEPGKYRLLTEEEIASAGLIPH